MSQQTTCGIFLIDSRDKCLVVHPTGHALNSWSIPKGKVEADEDHLEAAIRELKEETGLDLAEYSQFITTVRRLPEVKYTTRKKVLVPFVIWLSISMKDVYLYCDSLVHRNYPENDDFKWVSLDNLYPIIHSTQRAVIQHVKALY